MLKRIIIYFVLFGFILGLLNVLDDKFNITGGDTPKTLILNQPALFVLQSLHNIAENRESYQTEETPKPIKNPLSIEDKPDTSSSPSRYSPGSQEKELSKNKLRNDWLIGENGIVTLINQNFGKVFPLISALAWGIIGIIVALLKRFTYV